MASLFGFSGPPDPGALKKMDGTLLHRGGRNLLTDQVEYATIAVRPLGSMQDLPGGEEGLAVRNGRAAALAGYLTNRHKFGPDAPADILEMYLEKGVDFIQDLRGAFLIVLRDGKDLYLFRDGAGARTAYYGLHNGRFIFAAESKGVLAFPGFPRRLRPGAVPQYLTFSFIPGSGTMLEDLRELPAGHFVKFDGQSVYLNRYFKFEEDEKQDLPDEDWTKKFRRAFGRAVEERLPTGRTVGLFLSGGIDSSVVAAEAARLHNAPVKTFAIHFGRKYPNELEYAAAVAQMAGTEHEEVEIKPKSFLPRLRKIIWHLDDPIGDPITVPNFELSSYAAREVDYVLNGEGGDPLFGGPKNIPMLLEHWYGGIKRTPDFRERAYLASYRRCYDDLEQLLTPDFQKMYDHGHDLIEVLRPFFQTDSPESFVDKLQVMNIRLKGAHLILPKVDRMTGAWGLRQMAPLFDERLIRQSLKMPVRMKLRGGVEKVVLKKSFRGDLPAEVIARPKSGMRVPVHYWFKKEMKRYAKKILNPKSLKREGIFNPARVKQLLDYNIEEGPGRYGLRLWMLITFEIWRRIVVEGEAP